MKYQKDCTTFLLYLIVWGHTAEAMTTYKIFPILPSLGNEILDDDAAWVTDTGRNSIDMEGTPTHSIMKRNVFFEKPGSSMMSSSCSDVLNLCAASPRSKIFCVLNCMTSYSDYIKHLLWVLPSMSGMMCLLTNNMFMSMPKKLMENKDTVNNLDQFLKLFEVKLSDQADFAKSSANALLVTLIKNLKGADFDELKPVLYNMEMKENQKGRSRGGSVDMGSMYPNFQWDSMGKGNWINSQCKNMEATGPSSMLANAMKKRPCLSDSSLPGYFVFNKIPSSAWTKPILPILRAWNSPLLLMTGSKCCMIPFAEKSKKHKCMQKYQLLEKPHGMPAKSGPSRVCGAIDNILDFAEKSESTDAPCDYVEDQLGRSDYAAGDPCATENPLEMMDMDYSSSEQMNMRSEPLDAEQDEEYNTEDLNGRSDMMYNDDDN
ncbi:unnamed protein product [Orchesella dallaii]|uniref:Uncharacterized protein n=1 Tax=Orchesella dallaii TaxID=48710 RepID=A0ABP1Q4G6_9HEXA